MVFPTTLLILFGCIITSRIVSEQALRRLTADQKVRLSDEFASMRAYSYIPLIVTLLLVFGLRSQQLDCPALHLASH